jgi:hypothetical protein
MVTHIGKLLKTEVWERILKQGVKNDNGCLIWQGNKNKAGYGITCAYYKRYLVHRLSYLIHSDLSELPKQSKDETVPTVIRHLCNVRLCFEPSHLELGTRKDNANDRLGSKTDQRGEGSTTNVISGDLAKAIKLSKGEGTPSERAKRFNVKEHYIWNIDTNKTWTHIPDANGIVNDKSRTEVNENKRRLQKLAKQRVWTEEMFKEANRRLLLKTKLSETIKTPFVTTKCHLWTAKVTQTNPRGSICVYGKSMQPHALACEIGAKRHRKDGEICRHLCGIDACCNPEHIVFGTSKENAMDKIKHGSCNNILTREDVIEIRKAYQTNKYSQDTLADKYGVSRGTIRDALVGKTWKHVAPELIITPKKWLVKTCASQPN